MKHLFIFLRLRILDPAHVQGTQAEHLPLHVNSVLSDKSISSPSAGHAAHAGSLAALLSRIGVTHEKFVLGVVSHISFSVFI